MRFRQALIKYSLKHGVTKSAIRYKVNRQYVSVGDVAGEKFYQYLRYKFCVFP